MRSNAGRLLVVFAACLLLLPLMAACGGGGEENAFKVKSEVVTDAAYPTALAFAPDGRLFYAEQFTGNIRVVNADGKLESEPFAHVDAFEEGIFIEWGLMGMALDPEFQNNGYVYVYYTQLVDAGPPQVVKSVVARLKKGSNPEVLIGDLAQGSSFVNIAGNINFGPDGFLYVSVGDHDVFPSAQDLSVPQGKILRVDKETGKAAPGNPFAGQANADPRIFAYGFREDFDFVFHPKSGQLYGTDQTPVSCSELNNIEKGKNYGWLYGEFPWSDCSAGVGTHAIHYFAKERQEPGVFLSFTNPRGMSFISGATYPLIGDALVVCERETKLLRRLTLGGAAMDQVVADDPVLKDCLLDAVTSPNGALYYSNDKEIRRLVQEPIETKQ